MTPNPDTKLAALALRVLVMLDQQQAYFRTKNPAALAESKRLERNLRKECEAILTPPVAKQPGLFDEVPA